MAVLLPRLELVFPQTSNSVHPTYLLFDHARVPLGMKLDDDAARLVEVEPLATDFALRNQYPREARSVVEAILDGSTNVPLRGTIH